MGLLHASCLCDEQKQLKKHLSLRGETCNCCNHQRDCILVVKAGRRKECLESLEVWKAMGMTKILVRSRHTGPKANTEDLQPFLSHTLGSM